MGLGESQGAGWGMQKGREGFEGCRQARGTKMNECSKELAREVQVFVQKVCARNMLQIYDMRGEFRKFDYQRHVCRSLKQVPGLSHTDKIINSIMVALHLGFLWSVHLHKANYPLPWFVCIQVEREWLQQKRCQKGPSPYVILSVEELAAKVMNHSAFKIWTGQHPIIKKALERSGLQSQMKVYFDEIHGIIRFVPAILQADGT